MNKNKELQFESNEVKVYVQQLQAENSILRQSNDEKNELLIKLGCPTTSTAKRKVLCFEKELEKIKEINNEIKTDLKNWDERFKLQNAFIDNLLKATNNSIWIDKSISNEEASEIIEKIEMDYIEFEEGKEINAELKAENEHLLEKEEEAKHYLEEAEKFKNCISEIKSLCYEQDLNEDFFACEVLQKIEELKV